MANFEARNENEEQGSSNRINASESSQQSGLLLSQSRLAQHDLDLSRSPSIHSGEFNGWGRYHIYKLSEPRTRFNGSEASVTDSADEEYESSDYSDSDGSSEFSSNFGSEYYDCFEYIDKTSSEEGSNEGENPVSLVFGTENGRDTDIHGDDDDGTDVSIDQTSSTVENAVSCPGPFHETVHRFGEPLKQEDIDWWIKMAIERLSGSGIAELKSVLSAIRQATIEQLWETFRNAPIQWCSSCSGFHGIISSPGAPAARSSSGNTWDKYRKDLEWQMLEDREWANNHLIAILHARCGGEAMKVLRPVLNDEMRKVVNEEAFGKLSSLVVEKCHCTVIFPVAALPE